MTELLKVSNCSTWPFQAKHHIWLIWQLYKNPQVSHCIFNIHCAFPLKISSYISSNYRSHPANQCLSFSSSPHLFQHLLIHSSQPPHHLIIIFSLSLTPLSPPADWQCRHAKANWDVAAVTGPLYWLAHLHHPSQCPLKRTLTYTRMLAHTHCLQKWETCPGPWPSKLITLPWWSGPVNLTRPQPWRVKERKPSVSVSARTNVETINKMNRHKVNSSAHLTMEICTASAVFSLFIGGKCLLSQLQCEPLFFILFFNILV